MALLDLLSAYLPFSCRKNLKMDSSLLVFDKFRSFHPFSHAKRYYTAFVYFIQFHKQLIFFPTQTVYINSFLDYNIWRIYETGFPCTHVQRIVQKLLRSHPTESIHWPICCCETMKFATWKIDEDGPEDRYILEFKRSRNVKAETDYEQPVRGPWTS